MNPQLTELERRYLNQRVEWDSSHDERGDLRPGGAGLVTRIVTGIRDRQRYACLWVLTDQGRLAMVSIENVVKVRGSQRND
jgi:hypothetical protein